ncbi:MAG: 50S ribosomal protein L35 [Fidelibacterota bacterium]
MPKIKTRRGAAKRFSFTSKGKLKKNRANRAHLLGKKSSNRKRGLRHSNQVSAADASRVKKMLGE